MGTHMDKSPRHIMYTSYMFYSATMCVYRHMHPFTGIVQAYRRVGVITCIHTQTHAKTKRRVQTQNLNVDWL